MKKSKESITISQARVTFNELLDAGNVLFLGLSGDYTSVYSIIICYACISYDLFIS